MDLFAVGNLLFFAMVLAIWGVMAILEKRDRRPLPPRSHWSGIGEPGSAIVPKFADGWICRSCWSANRNQDAVCQRCQGRAPAELRAQLIPPIRSDKSATSDGELAGPPPDRVA